MSSEAAPSRFRRFFSWLLAIVGGLYTVLVLSLTVHDLRDDYLIRDIARPAANGRLSGVCEGSNCRVTVSAPGPDGQRITRTLSYWFPTARPPRSGVVMMSPDYPGVLSTDFGLRYFWDRVLGWAIICGSGLLVTLWGVMRLRRDARRLADSAAI